MHQTRIKKSDIKNNTVKPIKQFEYGGYTWRIYEYNDVQVIGTVTTEQGISTIFQRQWDKGGYGNAVTIDTGYGNVKIPKDMIV